MEPTPLDFSIIDDTVLFARGKYATLAFELRNHKGSLQSNTQDLFDLMRLILNQSGDDREHSFRVANMYLQNCFELSKKIDALTEQKDQLYELAWGSPTADSGEILGDTDPL